MAALIRDSGLAPGGHDKINWVKDHMAVLNALNQELVQTKPLQGKKVAVSVHLEAKTAYLCLVLRNAGATVAVTGSNPLSTQDDVAAALAEDGLQVFAWHDCTAKEYEMFLNKALDTAPDIIIDDGGDLVALLHGPRREQAAQILGGAEETTTGVLRLRALEREHKLLFPMIAVNDAYCKYLFDNRYGTGQSTWDGIMRTTNLAVAAKNVVVAGYGWCGKGVAMRAKGLGARVIVTEVDPIKAIEATFDGFQVLPMDAAARIGDIFITVTGCRDVITRRHFAVMKDGAVLANAGHFDVEVNVRELAAMAVSRSQARQNIEQFVMPDGRKLNLLAEGRLVNLAAGDGHPTEVMDMSFALQVQAVLYIATHHRQLAPQVYKLPPELDRRVAGLKLQAMGINIDSLTEAQRHYLYDAH